MEFCKKNGKFIANSRFQHLAKHITTWSHRRTNPVTKQTAWIYNQIDYIILGLKNKQVLTDARSYGGTETSSDHGLAVARIELTWARIYQQRMPNTIQKRFDTRQLTQNEENEERHREQIKKETESSTYVAVQQQNKWEKLKDIIKCAIETHIRYKRKVNNHQIENCKDPEKNKQLRKSRKEILKEMNQKVRDAREKRTEDLVGEVEKAKDDTRMFKAAKALHMKHQKIQFVHHDQERCVSQTQEVHKIIEQHFMKHFNKENINHIKMFITGAKRLKRKITAKEVKSAVWKMTNNKAPGKDNINVELIKYAPEKIYKEFVNILNGIYERNDTGIKLGTGILLPHQKPKKTQGPVKNLRSITFLEVIRKILSKIFMDRTEGKINKHLSQSQSP